MLSSQFLLFISKPPPPTVGDEKRHIFRSFGWPSVRPLTPITRVIILLNISGKISVKLGTKIHHSSGHCWKVFQGQRSKVKVICEQICKWCHGRGIHFDSVVVSRLLWLWWRAMMKIMLMSVKELFHAVPTMMLRRYRTHCMLVHPSTCELQKPTNDCFFFCCQLLKIIICFDFILFCLIVVLGLTHYVYLRLGIGAHSSTAFMMIIMMMMMITAVRCFCQECPATTAHPELTRSCRMRRTIRSICHWLTSNSSLATGRQKDIIQDRYYHTSNSSYTTAYLSSWTHTELCTNTTTPLFCQTSIATT